MDTRSLSHALRFADRKPVSASSNYVFQSAYRWINQTSTDYFGSFYPFFYQHSDKLKKLLITLGSLYIAYRLIHSKGNPTEKKMLSYATWQTILKDIRLPAAIIDLDAFDYNVKRFATLAAGKTIRLATKSLRVPELIVRTLRTGGPFKGVMCYAAEEAQFLYMNGIDDLLIAYPTIQPDDLAILRELHLKGAKLSLVVDSLEQIEHIEAAMKGIAKPFPLLIEMDMSYRPLGRYLHLGVWRSPVRSLYDLKKLLKASFYYPHTLVIGIMAYEAIVAGLPDKNPFKPFLNPLAYLIRKRSAAHIAELRAQIPEVFAEVGLKLEIFNGGGTGSFNFAIKERALTEVTIGSGLFCPHLFDYYSNLESLQLKPAAFFALPVVRIPDPGKITCSDRGYIASGETGLDRLSIPVSPPGLTLIQTEGAGEVQTPLEVKDPIIPPLGGPVLFRPPKCEFTERYNTVHLVSKDTIIKQTETYRGLRKAF